MIKILIVDDVKIVRECLKIAIEKNSDFEVVGCACDGFEAVEMCKEHKPDVMLMDLAMPKLNGIDAIIKIREEDSKVKILVLSSYGDEMNIINSIRNGADGYVLKEIGVDDLILAITCIYKGLSFVHKNAYSPSINSTIEKPNKISLEKHKELNNIFNSLTNREKSFLELVAKGMTNEEIALLLNLSEGRIRNVVSSLISKFMLNSRTQLAVTAVKFQLKQ